MEVLLVFIGFFIAFCILTYLKNRYLRTGLDEIKGLRFPLFRTVKTTTLECGWTGGASAVRVVYRFYWKPSQKFVERLTKHVKSHQGEYNFCVRSIEITGKEMVVEFYYPDWL